MDMRTVAPTGRRRKAMELKQHASGLTRSSSNASRTSPSRRIGIGFPLASPSRGVGSYGLALIRTDERPFSAGLTNLPQPKYVMIAKRACWIGHATFKRMLANIVPVAEHIA